MQWRQYRCNFIQTFQQEAVMSRGGQLGLWHHEADRRAEEASTSKQAAVHEPAPNYLQHGGKHTQNMLYNPVKASCCLTFGCFMRLPCPLCSLSIQYRTPSESCFILSVSDKRRRRFLLNFISLLSVLCCFRSPSSQPPALVFFSSFTGATFRCFALGPLAAADVDLRFLSDMMSWPVSDLVSGERTEAGLWLLRTRKVRCRVDRSKQWCKDSHVSVNKPWQKT